jgi:thiol-disulfide isomerase/thioredoxin
VKKIINNQIVKFSLAATFFCLLFAAGSPAQAFELKDMNGQTIKLSDYKGKWVLLNFWATWCGPCLEEIPELIDLNKAHKDKDLVVLGVMMDYETNADPTAFIEKIKMDYPVIPGTPQATGQFRDVSMLPISYLYNKKGELVEKHFGEVSREGLEEYIQDYGKKSKKIGKKKIGAANRP